MSNEGKNSVGRPPIHTNPKEVEKLVMDYFDWIKGEYHEEEKDGDIVTICDRRPEPPTVTGLALHLGFCSKDTLYQYAKKDEFSDSIKKGLSMVEKHHELQIANGDKCTGNIFALKNMGWKDKIEQDNNHSGTITITRHVKK